MNLVTWSLAEGIYVLPAIAVAMLQTTEWYLLWRYLTCAALSAVSRNSRPRQEAGTYG